MCAPRSAHAGGSANQFADVQKVIRKIIPPDQIETMADNIGMPISGINMTYNNTGVIGPQDGDIRSSLGGSSSDRTLHQGAARTASTCLSGNDICFSASRYRHQT